MILGATQLQLLQPCPRNDLTCLVTSRKIQYSSFEQFAKIFQSSVTENVCINQNTLHTWLVGRVPPAGTESEIAKAVPLS